MRLHGAEGESRSAARPRNKAKRSPTFAYVASFRPRLARLPKEKRPREREAFLAQRVAGPCHFVGDLDNIRPLLGGVGAGLYRAVAMQQGQNLPAAGMIGKAG